MPGSFNTTGLYWSSGSDAGMGPAPWFATACSAWNYHQHWRIIPIVNWIHSHSQLDSFPYSIGFIPDCMSPFVVVVISFDLWTWKSLEPSWAAQMIHFVTDYDSLYYNMIIYKVSVAYTCCMYTSWVSLLHKFKFIMCKPPHAVALLCYSSQIDSKE
jgi:hypothetical protein